MHDETTTIRQALTEAGQPPELAESLRAIATLEGMDLHTLVQWIHIARGEITGARLQAHACKLKELMRQLEKQR